MGINSVTSANSMSAAQMTTSALKDQKSKSIQNEIAQTQQQMQKLSAEEDLSANEKAAEQKKLRKEISDLNAELKQHQQELLRAQRREQLLAELREKDETAKERDPEEESTAEKANSTPTDSRAQEPSSDRQPSAEPGSIIAQDNDGTVILKEISSPDDADDAHDTKAEKQQTDETTNDAKDTAAAADSRPTSKEIHALVSADSSLQQANRLGTIIAKTSDGVAFLKEEITQARDQDLDTERQKASLRKLERQERLAMAFRSSLLGEANNAMRSVTDPESKKKQTDKAEKNAYLNALNLSQQEQTAPQKFYMAFT